MADELFSTRSVDGVKVLAFQQTHILDAATIDRMSAGLKEVIETAPESKFLFDFDRVEYLSSNALGMLIGLQRRIAQRKGRLKLAGIHPEVMEVFRITKLDTVFDIYKDAASAVETFRKNL
ncbi:MAG: STAS domain-containing protein [Planctomycetota bacterium]|nr:STAS domain-containing protein [Planctomycetota bacterium]